MCKEVHLRDKFFYCLSSLVDFRSYECASCNWAEFNILAFNNFLGGFVINQSFIDHFFILKKKSPFSCKNAKSQNFFY
jgi:hypothetical protein